MKGYNFASHEFTGYWSSVQGQPRRLLAMRFGLPQPVGRGAELLSGGVQRWLLDVAKRHTEGDLSRLETKTGVNRSILSQYTNGRKDVSDRHALRISNKLNIAPPEDLKMGLVVEEQKVTTTNTPPRYVPRARIPDVLAYVPTKSEQLAHDVWCLSFECCGIRWTDLGLLVWPEVAGGWLNLEQHKTAFVKRVKLTKRAQAILSRYAGGKFVLKVCGDRRATDKELSARLAGINPILRGIGKKLGLPVPLTTHTARHTWTEWALSTGMPLTDVKRQLGLKSWKAFEAYIARFNPQVASDTSAKMEEAFGSGA